MKFKICNKKSQSLVVASVLIILIVIIAVIILWNVFNPLVEKKSSEISMNSFTNIIDIKEADLFVTGASKVIVNRKDGNDKLDFIKFVFYDENNNMHNEDVSDNLPFLLETKTYTFSPFKDFGKIKQVSAYPVINGKLGIESKINPNKILEIPSGLVSWWRFNNDLLDDTGKNNGAGNEVVFVQDDKGISGFFNSESAYADFGNDSSLNLNNEFAISFWINSSSYFGNLLKKGDSYGISLVDGKIIFSYSNLMDEKSNVSLVGVVDGKWHHVVITNLMFYIDGKEDKILNLNDVIKGSNNDLVVGNGFNGETDELMIFNKSISGEQAKSIFNAGRS